MCRGRLNDEISDDSDVSMSDSEEEQDEIDDVPMNSEEDSDENGEEEEEDEVIKAIRLASNKKNNHPPVINMEEDISTLSFHPYEDILAVGDVAGDIHLYKYSLEENTLLCTLEHHTTSCRDIDYSSDGKVLYTAGSDKSIMLSDMTTQKLLKYYEDAHECPINCLAVVGENVFSTGDDDGTIKLWDPRANQQIYRAKKHEDYISAIITNEDQDFLFCASGDGSMSTFDLRNRKFLVLSEEYQEDLTSVALFCEETKLLVGTNKGRFLLFNWNQFGSHSDAFPGTKSPINSLVPITQNIVVTACDDGILRATYLFPNRHLGIVGQHEDSSAEKVDICNKGTFIASYSLENDIRFWNIEYFSELGVEDKHKKHNAKKEMRNNLPSSKYVNSSDFFSGLVE